MHLSFKPKWEDHSFINVGIIDYIQNIWISEMTNNNPYTYFVGQDCIFAFRRLPLNFF